MVQGRRRVEMDHRPLHTLPLMKGFDYWNAWTRNPIESDYWKPFDIEAQHSQVRVPALNLSGWNDDPYPASRVPFVTSSACARTGEPKTQDADSVWSWDRGRTAFRR